jgi:hypothetical protein
MFANNEIKNNSTEEPPIDAAAFNLLRYDLNGNLVFGANNLPKRTCDDGIDNNANGQADEAGELGCNPKFYDNLDSDSDGLVDELDELSDKANIGHDSIYESLKSMGNLYINNKVHHNGYYLKEDCTKQDDSAR